MLTEVITRLKRSVVIERRDSCYNQQSLMSFKRKERMPATTKRGQSYTHYRTGNRRQVIGFTTKPSEAASSDGVKRVRLSGTNGREYRVRADQLLKSYRPTS